MNINSITVHMAYDFPNFDFVSADEIKSIYNFLEIAKSNLQSHFNIKNVQVLLSDYNNELFTVLDVDGNAVIDDDINDRIFDILSEVFSSDWLIYD